MLIARRDGVGDGATGVTRGGSIPAEATLRAGEGDRPPVDEAVVGGDGGTAGVVRERLTCDGATSGMGRLREAVSTGDGRRFSSATKNPSGPIMKENGAALASSSWSFLLDPTFGTSSSSVSPSASSSDESSRVARSSSIDGSGCGGGVAGRDAKFMRRSMSSRDIIVRDEPADAMDGAGLAREETVGQADEVSTEDARDDEAVEGMR